MSVTTGKDAYFKIKTGSATSVSSLAYINNYSLNINNANLDITPLGVNWKEFQDDLRDWSATASGNFDLSDTAQSSLLDFLLGNEHVKVELHMGIGTKEWVGSSVITSCSVSAQVGSAVTLNYSFQGSGALELKEVTA